MARKGRINTPRIQCQVIKVCLSVLYGPRRHIHMIPRTIFNQIAVIRIKELSRIRLSLKVFPHRRNTDGDRAAVFREIRTMRE